ncbi:hypothetical protein PoB_002665600 [Plakobranchus ocellatus]|uniref:Uncharacterized protein n=1 Tax=Plakobranchus ocellatus TaxID=259542 RepID=A0AAV4A058_9GAST|nr:hypothetical protein PoB_002665600 [Plakobranchus ocellatus]
MEETAWRWIEETGSRSAERLANGNGYQWTNMNGTPRTFGGVGGTVACEFALRFAGPRHRRPGLPEGLKA